MLDRDFVQARVSLLKALADETRLQILETLQRKGELPAGRIVKAVGKEQSVVSHHLSCLRSCGLVSTRRSGREIYYRLNGGDRVSRLLDLTDQHVADVLEAILACRVVGDHRRRR